MSRPHILKVSRLESLTEGIFAIAMTILALNLALPASISSEGIIQFVFHQLFEKLFVYIGSFIILGTLWIAMSFQVGLLEKLNRTYLWMHIFYLMAVCVIPFSANLLATYPHERISIFFYACNLLFASFMQFMIAQSAHYFQLNNEMGTQAVRYAILQRIFLAPVFYLSAMLIAFYNNRIAFILLILPTIIYMIPGRVDRYDH